MLQSEKEEFEKRQEELKLQILELFLQGFLTSHNIKIEEDPYSPQNVKVKLEVDVVIPKNGKSKFTYPVF